MIILLPLLMAYSLIGETAHEWLGLFMFLLFILHHSMNPACIGAFRRQTEPISAVPMQFVQSQQYRIVYP